MPPFSQRDQKLRKAHRTTRLPALLRDELQLPRIESSSGADAHTRTPRFGSRGDLSRGAAHRGGGRGRPLSRIETRKLQREDQKARRGAHSSHRGQDRPTSRPINNGLIDTSKGKRRQEDSKDSQAINEDDDDDDDDADADVQAPSSSGEDAQAQPKKRQKLLDPSSSLTSRSDHTKQRRNVAADELTPLQRLLDKSSSASSIPASTSLAPNKAKRQRSSRALLTQQEEQEEQEIAWLEAMLGQDRKGKVGKRRKGGDDGQEEIAGQEEDGLDDLLGELDKFYPGMYEDGDEEAISNKEASDDEDEDDDDWSSGDGYSVEEEEDDEDHDDFTTFPDEAGGSSDGPDENSAGMDDVKGLSEQNGISRPATVAASANVPVDSSIAKPVTGRYIPPAARAAAASNSVATSSSTTSASNPNLPRQLQGLLNRLGDSNLDSILSSIEGVYNENPRAEVSETLTKLILDTIAARSNVLLTDTFVVVQAGLIAGVVKVIGVEFAAGLIQELVARVSRYYQDALNGQEAFVEKDEGEGVGKEMSNLITLLAHLYNLQVIACPLIYDLIKLFLGQGSSSVIDKSNVMTELDVELLLKLIKACGAQLRSDDASSLKAIVTLATEQCAKAASSSSTRTRFMLETLNDLKNNRAKSVAAQANDASTQLLAQLRKYLAGMEKKRTVKSREALRLVLRDLEEAGQRGKWWLVGAGWKGQEGDLVGSEETLTAFAGEARGVTAKSRLRRIGQQGEEEESLTLEEGDSPSTQTALQALARRHGMNTPSRRLIFSTLLSGTDFLSSSQSLLTLKLSETQRREIIRVLLHVLSREEIYNPFYSLVGVELAKRDGGMKITMQFSLWDYLRSIGEKRVGGRSVVANVEEDDDDDGDGDGSTTAAFGNEDGEEGGGKGEMARMKMWHLARCYGWWIAKGALGLNVLRTVSFSSLKSRSKTFLHLLFLHLILSTQTNNPSLAIKRRATANAPSKGSSHTVGDARPLQTLFNPSLLNNADLVIGLAWFFQQWAVASSSHPTARPDGSRRGSAPRFGAASAAAAAAGDSLRELIGDDPAVYDRVTWAMGVIRETLAAGAGGGAG